MFRKNYASAILQLSLLLLELSGLVSLVSVEAFRATLPSTNTQQRNLQYSRLRPDPSTDSNTAINARNRKLGLLLASVSDTKEADSSSAPTPTTATTPTASFISPIYQCYIEDTDSYGVMYNANYLRCFDRALHSFYAMGNDVITVGSGSRRDANEDEQRQSSSSSSSSSSILDTHEDWAIVQVDNQKFRSSPKLGEGYCVHGTLVEQQDDDLEAWDLSMQTTTSTEDDDDDAQSTQSRSSSTTTIFNSARVTIARPGVFATPSKVVANFIASTTKDGGGGGTAKDIFRLYRDEFDSHCPTHIPLRNVLTLFERSRSNFLGGPDSLRKLKEDHGLLFVVTKVTNCCKFPILDEDDELKPGKLVLVETSFQVKRKGMVIECHQTLKEANNLHPVAQATVSLMALDAETFKPSTNLPDWLKEILEEHG